MPAPLDSPALECVPTDAPREMRVTVTLTIEQLVDARLATAFERDRLRNLAAAESDPNRAYWTRQAVNMESARRALDACYPEG
jgi:hypothetical protein